MQATTAQDHQHPLTLAKNRHKRPQPPQENSHHTRKVVLFSMLRVKAGRLSRKHSPHGNGSVGAGKTRKSWTLAVR